jgi:pimeloyl-ACP methyl ester carboxylesterase
MGELLPTTILETEEIVANAGPAQEYAGITAAALFACGARSAPYYRTMNERLAAVMSNARTYVLPRSSHNAACIARPNFADMVAGFLTQTPVGRPGPGN